MANFWEIKRIKDESILVTEKQASETAEAIRSGKEFIVIGKEMLNTKTIASIAETNQAIPQSEVYLLAAGKDEADPPSPVLNLEGAVVTNWWKRPVSLKEWQTYYSKMTYRLLSNDSNGVWMAWRRPEMYNDNRPLPFGAKICSKEEAEMLWRMEERK